MGKPVAIVVGVGAERGLGAALCRRFASEGHHVLVAGRSADKIEQVVRTIQTKGGSAEPVATDTTREQDVVHLFDRAFSPSAGVEPADLVVYNAGNNRKLDFRELPAEMFEDFWRIGCFGGFLVGREAARRLVPLGRGTVLFTGASGSMRGKPGFAHFAAAKAGLRMISQRMAREFGPHGIHVAHVVIDGGIDGDRLDAEQTILASSLDRLRAAATETIAIDTAIDHNVCDVDAVRTEFARHALRNHAQPGFGCRELGEARLAAHAAGSAGK
jgi:NAD(P)-dependent dehydrogenase (short-subunit alcohol dehydrogenase family)